MKKILLCTDLTEASSGALNFAIAIAKKMNAKIVLLHTWFMPIPLGDATFQSVPPDMGRLVEHNEKELEDTCRRIRNEHYESGAPLECETKFSLTRPVPEILNDVEDYDPELVIMGARSVPALQRWFGTTASEVASRSRAPVLIVPAQATYSGFRNVVYATDLEDDCARAVDVIRLGEYFGSKVRIVHINNPSTEMADMERFSRYKDEVLARSRYSSLEFNTVTYKDTTPALTEYVTRNEADLLVLCKRHYPFMERLFHKSVSNEVIFSAMFPVLILH